MYNYGRIRHIFILQAFIKTAGKIYQKIEEGIFDVSNEVWSLLCIVILS
jgi:hypothetical protein